MENRNTIIALVLMAVVWFGYNLLFPPAPPVQQEQVPQAGVEQQIPAEAKVSEPAQGSTPVSSADNVQVPDNYSDREIVVDTPLYRAVFSSRGGRLVEFVLKRYRQEADEQSPEVALHQVKDPALGTLALQGSGSLPVSNDAPYVVVDGDDRITLQSGQDGSLVLRHDAGNGLVIDRIFRFQADLYTIDHDIVLRNQGANVAKGSVTFSLVHPWDDSQKGDRYGFVGPATLTAEDLETDAVKALKKESKTYKKPVWSAFETKYFITSAIPLEQAAEKVVLQYSNDQIFNNFVSPYLNLDPGSQISLKYRLYLGPLDFEIIDQVGHQMDKAIDLGFFTPIAEPLRLVLHFFHTYVGNWGLAIILLTVIIKLLFWPLTQKSYKSMREMQKLQPEMQKIREKYRHDREKMNQEMMALYKDKRVNPMGGCLPMLVQIPVFFALYKVLMVDIALRHAPFAFWLTDLSAKDPYYITPIIMGATMFIQQRMTPSSMDPTQAKVFMAMPIVFTFLFLNFPSGLVIYWLVNNILTIGQQYMIKRQYS
ncbi:MAG: membrane protein insertase YidC [Deltaproteobacteria bacterium]|nr:MAG: membrane protein insertase YidC [Deltaproteobacteria bacterium]